MNWKTTFEGDITDGAVIPIGNTDDGGEVQVTYVKRYIGDASEIMIDKIYSTGKQFHQTHHASGMTNIEISFQGKTFHVLLNSDGTLNKYYEK